MENNYETIADRLNQMIKVLGIKKSDLARRIGITDASTSTMFSGKTNPSSQTITLICREFGINASWLLYGEGDMFVSRSAQYELDAFFNSALHCKNPFRVKLLTSLSRLSDSEWEVLEKIVTSINEL